MPKTENTSPCKTSGCATPGLCKHGKVIAAQAMDEARVHTTSGSIRWKGWRR